MIAKPRRVALYLRVSTDGQSTALQRRDLVQACEHRGWEVTEVDQDAGISGAKGREGRPAFDRLCQDATRRRFDIIGAWSVDRLGRSLQDLVGFLSETHGAGVNRQPPPAGSRHDHAGRQSPLSDDGRVRRVRASDDPGSVEGRPRQCQGQGCEAGSAPNGCQGGL